LQAVGNFIDQQLIGYATRYATQLGIIFLKGYAVDSGIPKI